MRVEHKLNNIYKIYLHPQEAIKLKRVADTFHDGNTSLTINEAILEGLDVSLSVKALYENKGFKKQRKCPYCDSPIVETDKTLRGTINDSKRISEQ